MAVRKVKVKAMLVKDVIFQSNTIVVYLVSLTVVHAAATMPEEAPLKKDNPACCKEELWVVVSPSLTSVARNKPRNCS